MLGEMEEVDAGFELRQPDQPARFTEPAHGTALPLTDSLREGWLPVPGTQRFRPGLEAVHRRALCLGAVGDYGELEPAAQFSERNRSGLAELTEFAQSQLSPYLTPWERAIFGRPSFSEGAAYEASIALEPFGVLAWAIGFVETVLPYDRMMGGIEGSELARALRTAEGLELRPLEQLNAALREAEFWVARSQIDPLDDLDEVACLLARVTDDWLGPPPVVRDGDLLMHRDLALAKTPYHRLDDDGIETAASIAELRRHALRWLTGEMGEWSDYPTGRSSTDDPSAPRAPVDDP